MEKTALLRPHVVMGGVRRVNGILPSDAVAFAKTVPARKKAGTRVIAADYRDAIDTLLVKGYTPREVAEILVERGVPFAISTLTSRASVRRSILNLQRNPPNA